MRLQREPNEKWLDWHKRSFQRAKRAILSKGSAVGSLLQTKRKDWTAHVVRFGLAGRDNHLLKFVLAWRSNNWWYYQKLQNRGINRVVHKQYQGKLRRYDASLGFDLWTQAEDFIPV